MRRAPSLTLLVTVLALAACGGGEDPEEQRRANRDGAESTVRGYLTALVDKDGAQACARYTPEYRRSVLDQNRAFARQNGVDDCAGLIDEITRASRSISFEGKPLRRDTIGDLEFKTSVRQAGEELNATVTGAQGIQRYELETRDGKWLISGIERIRLTP